MWSGMDGLAYRGKGKKGMMRFYGIADFNIDMRSGKLVDLADMFPPDQLAEMKDSCMKQLVRQISDKRAAGTSAEATENSPQGPDEVSRWTSGLFMSSESWSFREAEAVVTFDEAPLDEPGELHSGFSAGASAQGARGGAGALRPAASRRQGPLEARLATPLKSRKFRTRAINHPARRARA